MPSVNKAIIVGHLGADPETRFFEDGNQITSFSVATSEQWKDKNTGEKKERTEWHRISAFGRQAEICSKYLTKGSQVYIEGKLATRKWKDKNNEDRYTTEIKISGWGDNVQFLGGGQKKDADSQPAQQPAQSQAASTPAANDDEDIPF